MLIYGAYYEAGAISTKIKSSSIMRILFYYINFILEIKRRENNHAAKN